jgi:methionyl-tRNA formyltransferase
VTNDVTPYVTNRMASAVVCAYHDVGVRCLSVLLAHGVDVRLVLTHEDSPGEQIWFGSVQQLAARYDIPCLTPANPNTPEIIARVRAAEPDFLFSFYYRSMLGADLLAAPKRAALNMHGSLLPKYRGRVPINWAIIHGETETGATLHHMALKPDAGNIVDQQAVPILPDDLAVDVFRKVVVAAEVCLYRALPKLIAGTAADIAQDLTRGSYFGGRKAADGVIDWSRSAVQVHNLVRAVAPPYPGASTRAGEMDLLILRTRVLGGRRGTHGAPTLFAEQGNVYAQAGDGGVLRVFEVAIGGKPTPIDALAARLATGSLPLPCASH